MAFVTLISSVTMSKIARNNNILAGVPYSIPYINPEASIKSDRSFLSYFNASRTMFIASDVSVALGSTAKALSSLVSHDSSEIGIFNHIL
jgi:hypothetical protein